MTNLLHKNDIVFDEISSKTYINEEDLLVLGKDDFVFIILDSHLHIYKDLIFVKTINLPDFTLNNNGNKMRIFSIIKGDYLIINIGQTEYYIDDLEILCYDYRNDKFIKTNISYFDESHKDLISDKTIVSTQSGIIGIISHVNNELLYDNLYDELKEYINSNQASHYNLCGNLIIIFYFNGRVIIYNTETLETEFINEYYTIEKEIKMYINPYAYIETFNNKKYLLLYDNLHELFTPYEKVERESLREEYLYYYETMKYKYRITFENKLDIYDLEDNYIKSFDLETEDFIFKSSILYCFMTDYIIMIKGKEKYIVKLKGQIINFHINEKDNKIIVAVKNDEIVSFTCLLDFWTKRSHKTYPKELRDKVIYYLWVLSSWNEENEVDINLPEDIQYLIIKELFVFTQI